MLLRFSFENFRSFRRKTTLSMVAKSQSTLNYILIRKNKKRILPTAVIYGANASGKSNVILAMSALQGIVESGSLSLMRKQSILMLELFKFIHDGNNDPVAFEVEFITGSYHYKYRLAFDLESINGTGDKTIAEEKLEQFLPRESITLFHRTKGNINFSKDCKTIKALGYNNIQQLENLFDSVVKNMDEKTLFLTGGFKSTINKVIANRVIDFILNMILSTTDFEKTFSNPFFERGINVRNGDILIGNKLFDNFIKAADFGPQQIGWLVKDKNNQDEDKLDMISKYRDVYIPSNLIESTGTIKLLLFSLWLRRFLATGGLMMIDEMDNAIHPEIVKGIIALLCNPDVNINGTQLIFTTHNPIYMDNTLLRRDQILFTERDPDNYESVLHSLGDFGSVSVRNDQSYIRNYFKGRYGSLPYVDLEVVLAQSAEG